MQHFDVSNMLTVNVIDFFNSSSSEHQSPLRSGTKKKRSYYPAEQEM